MSPQCYANISIIFGTVYPYHLWIWSTWAHSVMAKSGSFLGQCTSTTCESGAHEPTVLCRNLDIFGTMSRTTCESGAHEPTVLCRDLDNIWDSVYPYHLWIWSAWAPHSAKRGGGGEGGGGVAACRALPMPPHSIPYWFIIIIVIIMYSFYIWIERESPDWNRDLSADIKIICAFHLVIVRVAKKILTRKLFALLVFSNTKNFMISSLFWENKINFREKNNIETVLCL